MEKASPREVLRRHGTWISSHDFTKLLAEKRGISERQAKTIIGQSYRNKEIIKYIFSNRSVIYGLTEFGPPSWHSQYVVPTSEGIVNSAFFGKTDGTAVPFRFNQKPWIQGNSKWNPAPLVDFAVSQRHSPPISFPTVAFNLINQSAYRLSARIEVRYFLNGKSQGLIDDIIDLYNGKRSISLEPNGDGFLNGSFFLPQECAFSAETCSIEVRMFFQDRDDPEKEEYQIVRKWRYKRKENSWVFEPGE